MLRAQYEPKLISRGMNFPAFDLTKEGLDSICIGLHLGCSQEQLMNELSITHEQFKEKIDLLCGEGLVKKEEELCDRPAHRIECHTFASFERACSFYIAATIRKGRCYCPINGQLSGLFQHADVFLT